MKTLNGAQKEKVIERRLGSGKRRVVFLVNMKVWLLCLPTKVRPDGWSSRALGYGLDGPGLIPNGEEVEIIL